MTHSLGQTVAVERGARQRIEKARTAIYHTITKHQLFSGFDRTHEPYQDELQQPGEEQRVQENATELICSLRKLYTEVIDITATRDFGNMHAFADVAVDGEVLIERAPVHFLLWLENQLSDIYTNLRKFPAEDPKEEWRSGDSLPPGMKRTATVDTPSTKMVPKHLLSTSESDRHPQQVLDKWQDHVRTGTWHKVSYTTALEPKLRDAMVDRVNSLRDAVKIAREKANQTGVEDIHIGAALVSYIFGEISLLRVQDQDQREGNGAVLSRRPQVRFLPPAPHAGVAQRTEHR
jgi:hypothetical protein